MNWVAFAVVAWVLVGLETGLKDALSLGSTGIAPSFVLPLAVFVAMTAPAAPAVWACVLLGAAADLLWPAPFRHPSTGAAILGPHALGFALAGQLTLTLRGLMIRRNPRTMVFLSLVGSLVGHLVVVAMITARVMYGEDLAWDTGRELAHRALSSLYTAVAAYPIALVLFPLAPVFGVQLGQARFTVRR